MHRVIIATAASLMLTIGSLQASEFYDLQFPDKATLSGAETPLQLNGIGFRSKFFFKIYIGALYTVDKAASRDVEVSQRGPKRVLMHFVYDEIESEKLKSARMKVLRRTRRSYSWKNRALASKNSTRYLRPCTRVMKCCSVTPRIRARA
jgi:hypothetical protein